MSSSFKSFNVVNKKYKHFVLILSTLLLFIATPSYALTKPSNKCYSYNSIKYDSNDIFLCIKNKNSLVWQKQIKPKSVKDLNPLTSWFFSYKSIKQNKLSNCMTNFHIIASDNFSYEKQQNILEQLMVACRFWSKVNVDGNVTVLLGTEKDMQFWEDELKNISVIEGGIRYSMIKETYKTFGSTSNSASAGVTVDKKYYMTFEYGSNISLNDIKNNQYQTGIHEYTHTISWFLGKPGDVWLMEGQAELVGLSLSRNDVKSYYNYRNFRLSNQLNSERQKNIINYQDIKFNLYKNYPSGAIYSFSVIALEALTAIYGQDMINKYFIDVKNTKDFGQSFINVFGFSQEQFLDSISSYLEGSAKNLRINK